MNITVWILKFLGFGTLIDSKFNLKEYINLIGYKSLMNLGFSFSDAFYLVVWSLLESNALPSNSPRLILQLKLTYIPLDSLGPSARRTWSSTELYFVLAVCSTPLWQAITVVLCLIRAQGSGHALRHLLQPRCQPNGPSEIDWSETRSWTEEGNKLGGIYMFYHLQRGTKFVINAARCTRSFVLLATPPYPALCQMTCYAIIRIYADIQSQLITE